MSHRHGRTVVSMLLAAMGVGLPLVGSLAGCGEDKLKGPEAEVRKSDVKLDIPKVPDFTLPAANADGSHPVKAMRVRGKKLLDTEVTVKGFVTWVYDCTTAVRTPGESDEDVRKRIDEDPTICERAKFYVGDAKDTPPEKSLWVVDIPRPYNKLELERIKKKDRTDPLRCEPAEKDPKKSVCPPLAVGDEVLVVGTWQLSSPHSERNSDGLLVYKSLKNLTQAWESPAPAAAAEGAPGPAGGPPGAKPSPEDLVKKKPG